MAVICQIKDKLQQGFTVRNFLFLLLFLSFLGCGGINFNQPERWVENNTLYSTKLPGIEIKVTPALLYKKGEKTDAIVKSTDSNNRNTGVDVDWYYFVSTGNERLNIKIQTLTAYRGWYVTPPDYGKEDKYFVSTTEHIGGISFLTGIGREKYNGTPVLIKSFGAVVGETTRYELFYIEKVSADWLDKYSALFSTADRDVIAAFNKRANESFSVAPYSGILPPTKRAEQNADLSTKPLEAITPAPNTSKEPPDNIKKEIKQKCSADFPSDYAQQAECVKLQEAGWIKTMKIRKKYFFQCGVLTYVWMILFF